MAASKTNVSLSDMSVTKLVALLADTDDQGEKRRIRAKLRAMGHFGGAGSGRGRKPADGNAKKSAKPKKAAKAKKSEAAETSAA